jgi:signal transduction histidine kinase
VYQNWSGLYLLKGKVYFQKREWRNALANYRKGLPIAYQNQVNIDVLALYAQMSIAFDKLAQLDSSLHYAEEALVQESFHSTPTAALLTYGQLVSIYEQTGPADSTIKYLKLESQLNESQLDRDKVKQAQALIFDQRLREQEEEAKRQLYNEQIQRDILLVIIGAIIVIATLLYRNTVRQKKTNKKLDIAYNRLKNTQSQLIQSEKMASLGELTAGIAHEIQNPLNFVNNFSDVNKELTSELEEALQKGDLEEARAIAKDISANESKIVEHGHRADAIVKGMLQHSRESSGEKEPTDINALADEYLRLSYHGLRAKDKEFNADFTLEDDKSLPKINVVPQEIGRVLLNLINNAFQAVHERKLKEDDFEPKVTVRTRTEGNQIIFEVEDNGAGIPDDVKDKIFQPFYTTKPTGQGTGLGLSLSYDIITKGHGGQLKVETEVGEPTVFIVILPV